MRLHRLLNYIKIFVVILLLLCFCAACTADEKAKNSEKISIVTTIFPPYDFAREIAGENAQISMLLRPGTESHSYEPSPADIIAVENCDIFIYNGGESDAWVETLVENIDTSDCKVLRMMECVDALEEKPLEGVENGHFHEHESEYEHHEGMTAEYDEHIWTSPQNAMKITQAIASTIMEIDPERRMEYEANLTRYSQELSELDTEFKKITDEGKRKLIIFGDRFPFRYFADDYGLDYRAAFPGCSAESEPSVKTVAYLVDKIREEDIPNAFYIEFSNQRLVKTIQEETGALPLLFHSCHKLSRDEMERGDTYLTLMRKNAENLKEALK